MDKLLCIAIVVVIIFVLTYNPKSRTLEKYIKKKEKYEPKKKKPCCSVTDYRAEHPVQCEPPYYLGLQLGNPNYGCPQCHPQVWEGAIIAA